VIDDELAIALREQMVEDQIESRGIRDPRIRQAFRDTPRHLFAPEVPLVDVYDDSPQRIGRGQTISQPYIVALMTELLELKGTETVLEIGTGSGYQTAILAEIVPHVVTIERIAELQAGARAALAKTGAAARVTFRVGDGGALRHPEAPFERIIVTAAAEQLPEALTDQLAVGGILVAPVGPPGEQILVRVRRTARGFETEKLGGCSFVPLLHDE